MTIEVQDKLTEYLEELERHFYKSQPRLLESMAHDLAEDTMTFAPDWNPNLYLSGFEKRLWSKNISQGKSVIEILYTGFTKQVNDIDVWWEFATIDTMHGYAEDRELGRDYALYQETTYDRIADPKKAKHPHFIRKGSEIYANTMKHPTDKYLQQIMQLKELPRVPDDAY